MGLVPKSSLPEHFRVSASHGDGLPRKMSRVREVVNMSDPESPIPLS